MWHCERDCTVRFWKGVQKMPNHTNHTLIRTTAKNQLIKKEYEMRFHFGHSKSAI